MIKQAVNLEKKPLPSWAKSYLEEHALYTILRCMKATKRHLGLDHYLSMLKLTKVRQQIYCNKKGEVVFTWKTAAEKTMFFLKWD